MVDKFLVKVAYDRDDGERFFVNDKEVGYTNYDEDGSAGMESARNLFKKVAAALGADYEEMDVDGDFNLPDDHEWRNG